MQDSAHKRLVEILKEILKRPARPTKSIQAKARNSEILQKLSEPEVGLEVSNNDFIIFVLLSIF
jgi:hypothetical protein